MSDQNQGDLFEVRKQLVLGADLCTPYHRGADTSVEAFQSTPTSRRTAQQTRIFKYVSDRGEHGATCSEVEQALEIPHQTASARITELSALGRIKFGVDRRKTMNGKSARVYRAAHE